MNKNLLVSVLIALMLCVVTGAFSQDCGYYPVKKGSVCGYQSTDGKGKPSGRSRVTMLDVTQSGNSAQYQVKAEYWDEKDKPQPSREYSMLCENGVFSIDMKSLIDPKSLEGFKDMELSFNGQALSYPEKLSAGQSLTDGYMSIGVASGGMNLMKLTIDITNRKVVGTETVTVPAGTFDCYKITYNVDSKFGFKVSTTATEWLNKGAGTVKTETYDKNGKLLGTTVLNELSR